MWYVAAAVWLSIANGICVCVLMAQTGLSWASVGALLLSFVCAMEAGVEFEKWYRKEVKDGE